MSKQIAYTYDPNVATWKWGIIKETLLSIATVSSWTNHNHLHHYWSKTFASVRNFWIPSVLLLGKKLYCIEHNYNFLNVQKEYWVRYLFFLDISSNSHCLVTPNNLQHYCRVCNIQLNSCRQAKIHSEGKKHDKRLSYLRFCLESSKYWYIVLEINQNYYINIYICIWVSL